MRNTNPLHSRVLFLGSALGLALVGSMLVTSPANAKSTTTVEKLDYTFTDSSIPEARNLKVKITGAKLTVEVLGGGKSMALLNATIPPKLLATTNTQLQQLTNITLTGNICPGAQTNDMEITIGKKKVKRTAATCSGDNDAANKKSKKAFYETEAVMAPLFRLVGDRETAFGTRG